MEDSETPEMDIFIKGVSLMWLLLIAFFLTVFLMKHRNNGLT